MVFTLQRYIFREVFKVFIPATVALTLIMSLGSTVRPIQEYGIGPWQVLHLMGYFLPIGLTFVLPVAALFAGALVHGRLASDNELNACRASGISLLTLVYPGLILAIIVAIANLFLSFNVVPYFVHLGEKSIKADAKQILFRNIQRRGYYRLPPDQRHLIYADQANEQNDMLSGVIVIEVSGGEIRRLITSDTAKITFIPHERVNEVRVTAENSYEMDSDNIVTIGLSSFTSEFESLLGDAIRFKRIDEMKRIRADLTRFYPIAKLARDIRAQFTTELLAQDIETKVAGDPNNLYTLHSGEKFVEFTASGVAPYEESVELSGEVVVVESDAAGRQPLRTLRCERAVLHIEGDKLAPTLTMDIYNARVEGTGDLRMRYIIRGLILPRAVTDKFKTGDILENIRPEVVSSALQEAPPSLILKELQNRLQWTMRKTLLRIIAEIHSRLVFGIGCVPMILIGIGLGIILKGGHLLSAFGASCVPATVLIVCISSGIQMINNLGVQAISGIAVMWAGVVFLAVLAVGIYCWLLRN
ncbi:MAG: LptF/LptG family permease [Planctomycetota bacterium]|jgi:lipopolysaccharide export LptBFGC system permease protein LptF